MNLYKEFFEMSASQNQSLFGYADFVYHSHLAPLFPSFQLLSIGAIIILSFICGVLIGRTTPSTLLPKNKVPSKRLMKDRYHVDEENTPERTEEMKVFHSTTEVSLYYLIFADSNDRFLNI